MSERPAIAPEEFAAIVAQATDEQLAEGLAVNREPILEEIFRQMPASLRPEARRLNAVIEWRVDGDRWQLVVRDGECSVERDGGADPDVTLRLSALDFLKLVSGRARGPQMFIFGRLRVRGDLVLAARLPALFRIPGARRA